MSALLVIIAAWIGWAPMSIAPTSVDQERTDQTGRTQPATASSECVRFQSPGQLAAGSPFRAMLMRGLEFRLSPDWDIGVGPVDEPNMDYLWVVSPPLQVAPHRLIGPGYGLTARESARISRPLRFVLTRSDYDAARAAITNPSGEETLKEMDRLGRGRLSLVITSFQVRDVPRASGQAADAFDWITFAGEACVGK